MDGDDEGRSLIESDWEVNFSLQASLLECSVFFYYFYFLRFFFVNLRIFMLIQSQSTLTIKTKYILLLV